VGVGFGIKDAQSAATVGEFADAVVIGSVLVNKMEELQDNPEQIPDVISGIISNIHSSL
jgi:tryptophan synthase alpha chain